MGEPEQEHGLLGMTSQQLRAGYRRSLDHVQFSANDYYREIERRTQEKHSKAMLALTGAIAALAVITTVVTLLALF
jgi:hypothetical protein